MHKVGRGLVAIAVLGVSLPASAWAANVTIRGKELTDGPRGAPALSVRPHKRADPFRSEKDPKTKLAAAQVWTIRESLLKIGARVHLSVRRVYVAFSSAHPMREVFTAALLTLRSAMAA
jgi:hypothetical protein